jgi:hypothetical protein
MFQGSRLMVRAAAKGSAANWVGSEHPPSLREENAMDGQDGVGFGFVVREIISGPRELEEAAPAQAVTLACLAAADGEGQFWCGQLEQPVKHRIGPASRP